MDYRIVLCLREGERRIEKQKDTLRPPRIEQSISARIRRVCEAETIPEYMRQCEATNEQVFVCYKTIGRLKAKQPGGRDLFALSSSAKRTRVQLGLTDL
jgi:hypothetical protein